MKKLMIGVATLLFTTSAFAQNTMKSSSPKFGLKAGVNLSKAHYSGSDVSDLNNYVKNNIGYNVTAYGDFALSPNFFIQPGISLQNKGSKLEGTIGTAPNAITGANTTDVMVVEIPVNAVYRIPTGDAGAVLISAGPYVGFNVSGKSKVTVTAGAGSEKGLQENDLKFGKSSTDDLSMMDFGANLGLGYRLNNGIGFGANYGLGLNNLIPKDKQTGNNKAQSRVLGFYLSYSL